MKRLAEFDPLKMKNPIGAISKGEVVNFFVQANIDCLPNELYLMLKSDGDDDYKYILMKKIENESKFFVSVEFKNKGLFFYNFKLNFNDFSKYLSKTNDNFSIVLDEKGEDFVQLVTSEKYESVDSLQGGLIYQIFVDRFCKVGEVKVREPLQERIDWGGKIKKNTTNPVKINEEVFCGNLKGVISKLDYLKNLGVTAIYLNPIFQANSNHKYDTSDFLKVDEMFGGDEVFEKLIREANEKNIKIIIDGVFNHTGSDSIYFNKCNRFDSIGAFNSKSSKFYEWYDFENYPEKYSSWWGIVTLPSIRKNSKSFQNFIAGSGGVIEKYMNMGVFGIRLDVVDELSDEFTKSISNKVLSYDKNAVVMGEVWEDASTKISYSKRREYFVDNELNSVMNYPIKQALINFLKTKNCDDLVSTIRMLKNNYPKVVMDNLMNMLGTHDTNRIFSELISAYGENEEVAKKVLKIGFAILYTLPGVPAIFYGDEYGMKDNDGSSRGCFDWENYDNEIFHFMKKLASVRKLEVLKDGEINILMATSGKFVFERVSKNQRIIILSNLRPSPLFVNLSGRFSSALSGKVLTDFVLSEFEFEILIENWENYLKIITKNYKNEI